MAGAPCPKLVLRTRAEGWPPLSLLPTAMRNQTAIWRSDSRHSTKDCLSISSSAVLILWGLQRGPNVRCEGTVAKVDVAFQGGRDAGNGQKLGAE